MPFYQKLGEMPRKHHIWFHRNGAAPTFKNEGIAYEHVITTEGFNEAYSIMYHLRPPTRVRSVKLLKCEELKKAADSPLRHHHLKTASMPRRGDLYSVLGLLGLRVKRMNFFKTMCRPRRQSGCGRRPEVVLRPLPDSRPCGHTSRARNRATPIPKACH